LLTKLQAFNHFRRGNDKASEPLAPTQFKV